MYLKTRKPKRLLYIDLGYLRKGIGAQPVRYLENWVRKQHPEIEWIMVDTAFSKYNKQLYEKNGYVKDRGNSHGKEKCRFGDVSF